MWATVEHAFVKRNYGYLLEKLKSAPATNSAIWTAFGAMPPKVIQSWNAWLLWWNRQFRRGHEGPFNAKFFRLSANNESESDRGDAEDAKECTLFRVVRYFMDTENTNEKWKKISR